VVGGVGIRSSDLLVHSLEVGYLPFCFLARNSVALLNSADKLIALALYDLPIIVGQFAPLLLRLPDELFPVSLHLVAIHFRISSAMLITLEKQREKLTGSGEGERRVERVLDYLS